MATQYPFIDMHTHLFNANYLPLDGVFRSWINGPFAELISKPLVILATAITDSAHPRKEEQMAPDSEPGADAGGDLFNSFFAEIQKTLSQRISSSERYDLRDDLFIDAIQEIVRNHGGDGSDTFNMFGELRAAGIIGSNGVVSETPTKLENLELTETIRSALVNFFETAGTLVDSTYLDDHEDEMTSAEARGLVGKAFEILRFVMTLVKSENNTYKALLKDYDDGKATYRQPEKILNLMMDMDPAYERFPRRIPPRYDFKDEQLDRMASLTGRYPGKIVTFAAIAPRRDNWEEYIEAAREHGFTGFKIYPPMGFRAADDPHYPPDIDRTELPRKYWPKQPKGMNERLREVLDYCCENKLPLFTHCTPSGFEAKKGWGLHCDPVYWREALKSRPGLILCLGHAGGTRPRDWGGWAAPSDALWSKTYASKVIGLCQDYQHVYCEFGYLLALLSKKHSSKYQLAANRFKNELRSNTGTYKLHTKIMFGSDWHMKSMIGQARQYLEVYYELFDDASIKQYAEGFFHKNAECFLSLGSKDPDACP